MSPDAIHDQALLTTSAWQRSALPATNPRDAQFEHRACRIAADLWDELDENGRLRDLTAPEQQFLTRVHQIGQDYVRLAGEAKRAFGSESKTALAVEWSAKKRRDERYGVALAAYERTRCEQDD